MNYFARMLLPTCKSNGNISASRETTMSVAWFFSVELDAFFLLFILLMSQQVLRRQIVSLKQRESAFGSAEGLVLLAMTTVITAKYCLELVQNAKHGELPELARGWVTAFAISCAIYVGTKAVRVLRSQNK